ncbi:hypothetical protein AVEN_23740-1 [Araneus ventricosus]|uniref:DUF4817 domain-containing protein n=1 Tax=Araneus ventricosus TaxID=182803 RepID=A0A4Y2PWV3_ARAVE|nr:hypothetical protein AVEN_23740-1 [Araneus ventricosus]
MSLLQAKSYIEASRSLLTLSLLVITTQRRFRITYKTDPPSDNSIRLWLTQFQETGIVLHRKGAGRPSTSQENVDRIQETFTRSPRKSTRQSSCAVTYAAYDDMERSP